MPGPDLAKGPSRRALATPEVVTAKHVNVANPKYGTCRRVQERLKTFVEWEKTQDPKEMAKAGFFYLGEYRPNSSFKFYRLYRNEN